MADPSTTRPDIDPILKAILDAVPLEFTIDDGIEVPDISRATYGEKG